MLVIIISSDILGMKCKNTLHVQVADVVSTIQIGAYVYLAFNQKTLGQHFAPDKHRNSN
jgi:hypothetical protein